VKWKATQNKLWEACLFFDQSVLFLQEVSEWWLKQVVMSVDDSDPVKVWLCCIRCGSVALVWLCGRLAY
jgi:hypothetical protein